MANYYVYFARCARGHTYRKSESDGIVMNIIMHHNECNDCEMCIRSEKQTLHKLRVFGTLLPFQHNEKLILQVKEESVMPFAHGNLIAITLHKFSINYIETIR